MTQPHDKIIFRAGGGIDYGTPTGFGDFIDDFSRGDIRLRRILPRAGISNPFGVFSEQLRRAVCKFRFWIFGIRNLKSAINCAAPPGLGLIF